MNDIDQSKINEQVEQLFWKIINKFEKYFVFFLFLKNCERQNQTCESRNQELQMDIKYQTFRNGSIEKNNDANLRVNKVVQKNFMYGKKSKFNSFGYGSLLP